MKKHLSLLTIFIGGALIAPAEDRPLGDPLPRFLQHLDTNEDGVIDEEERQAIADLRNKLRELSRKSIDADQDGQIKREEVEAAREILRIKKSMNDLYVKYTGQTLKKIESAMDRDTFLEADEAMKFGLVDKVFETRPEGEEPADEKGSGGAPE